MSQKSSRNYLFSLFIVLLAFSPVSASHLQYIDSYFDGPVAHMRGDRAIAISPDGIHAYVTGIYDNGLSVFAVEGAPGELRYSQGIDGINGALGIAVSPDGKQVYVAANGENALYVYSVKSPVTGRLVFEEKYLDGVGCDGLKGAAWITISDDGSYLYVTGFFDHAVSVWYRNPNSGLLTYVESHFDGIGGVDGLDNAYKMALSPAGEHLYVTGSGDGIAIFSRDTISGRLSFQGKSGSGGGFLAGITVSPDGNHVYLADSSNNSLVKCDRSSTGALTFGFLMFDPGGNVGLQGAEHIVCSADGRFLYVTGSSNNSVAVFERDGSTGSLTFVEKHQDGSGGIDGLSGADHVVLGPDGSFVLVTGFDDNAVTSFARDEFTGRLYYTGIQRDDVTGMDGLKGAFTTSISPDNKFLYVTGLEDNAVAVFARDTDTGRLHYVEMQQDGIGGVTGLGWPHSSVISPDSRFLYVTGNGLHTVVVFARDTSSGKLSFVEMQQDGVGGVDGLSGATGVTISPDNRFLYVTGMYDSAVAVFVRNTMTGRLSFVEMQQNGVAGVDGLERANAVTVSPDGKFLYVTGPLDDAVAVFARGTVTGRLFFVEVQKDGVGGVDGLHLANGVTISPDNKFLYSTSFGEGAVAVFARDTVTGRLSYIEMQKNGIDGVEGLGCARNVTISQDGKFLYVTAGSDNAVVVFSRSSTTGKLTYMEMYQDGLDNVDGLNDARHSTVSPDGRYLYVTGSGDNAVVVFQRPGTAAFPWPMFIPAITGAGR